MQFKPNLAAKVDFATLDFQNYHYVADYKYDGVRAVIIDGVVMSRSLKPIPNRHVQLLLGHSTMNGLDGELIVGEPNSSTVFRDTMSGVMSVEGEPDVRLMVFDDFSSPKKDYLSRWLDMRPRSAQWDGFWPIQFSTPIEVRSLEQVLDFESKALNRGYEGVMIRRTDRPYKFGRSTNTIRDQGLMKLKRRVSSEARIIGYECEYENTNGPARNALGYMERSHQQANKIPKDTLGRIQVKDIQSGLEFSIGIFRGYTRGDLDALWAKKDDLIGKVVSYDFFALGDYDKPRFPVMRGFRDPIDL